MIKKILAVLLFAASLFAESTYLLHNESIIIDKAAVKMEKMCDELYRKSGVGVYTSAVKSTKGLSIIDYGQSIAAKLKEPYVLLSIAADEQQVDMIMSPDVAEYIDKDEILDDFIIPILVSHNKKATLEQKYSAAIFNGIAEITDQVAAEHDIKLANSVGSESKNFYEGLMWIIKLMLIVTVAVLAYIYLSSKKEQQ